MRATWNGAVLAEAPRTVRVEGNHYFPPESVRREHLTESRTKSVCPWKGLARYYTVTVAGEVIADAGWYYPHPSPLARRIKNHVAFRHGVRVEGEQAMTGTASPDGPTSRVRTRARRDRLPVWRIGLTGGLVGILCCVGPTVLALLGIVSAGTAFAWATDLYDNYAWWFRLGGLAVLAALVWWSLRRRGQCSLAGVRRRRWRLLAVLGVAVGTYVALYALTTWLGTFA